MNYKKQIKNNRQKKAANSLFRDKRLEKRDKGIVLANESLCYNRHCEPSLDGVAI